MRDSTWEECLIIMHMCPACPVVMDTSFPIPVWALAPIILGGLLVLGIVVIIILKVAVVIAVGYLPVNLSANLTALFHHQDYCELKKWEKDAKDPNFVSC